MDTTINLHNERLKRELRRDVVEVARLSYSIPQCKLIRDFLASHNLPWQAPMMIGSLSRSEFPDLFTAVEELFRKITAEHDRLCLAYGVNDPGELSKDSRRLFDSALRRFVKQEDHFP